MKILVTGGTGTLGKELGKELVREGHQVTLITRQEAISVQKDIPFPCKIIRGDLNKNVLQLDQKFDVVFHLAGESIAGQRWSVARKKRLMDSRVNTTKNLVQSLSKNKPQVFISASGIGFYGDRKEESLYEESTPGSDFLSQICLSWENEAQEIQSPDCRLVLARISAVLNLQEGALPEMAFPFRLGLGAVIGRGNQWMSWIHIHDLVHALIHCMKTSSLHGAVNVTSPEPATNKQFSKSLATALNVPLFFSSPKFVLKILFGEKAEVILNSQKAFPKKLLESGFKFRFPQPQAALSDLCQFWSRGEDLLIAEQFFYSTKENLYDYFCDAKNLETITPPHLNFQIKKISTPEIQMGTLIDYKLKLYGIPIKWRTLIDEWNPPVQFVDHQLKGPYSLWNHSHKFEQLGEGTLMIDFVRYKVPFGFLGRIVAGAWVKKDVQGIFKYRRETISKLF